MNIVVVLKWVWRERSIVDGAHLAGMMVADTAKSRARTNRRKAPAGNVGRR